MSSVPSSRIAPVDLRVGLRVVQAQDGHAGRRDLPEPDSPTMPRVLPSSTV